MLLGNLKLVGRRLESLQSRGPLCQILPRLRNQLKILVVALVRCSHLW